MPEGPSLDSPRMRSRPLLSSLSLLLVCGLALAACGGDDEGTIPPANATAMLQSLEDAGNERDEGDCDGIADAAGNLETQIDELPSEVDPEVKTALLDGAKNLRTLAGETSQCEPSGPTGPSGQQTEPTTTEETTTEFTEPTTTEETTTTEEEAPPEQPPNEGGGGLGQGNEGGQPPSGGPDGGGPPAPPTGGTGQD